MASVYPTNLDDFADVSTGDTIAATHKNDLNAAVENAQAKIGKDGSAVTTSHDYLLTHLPAQASDWDAGAVEVRAQTFESDVVTGTAPLTVASTTVVTNLNADTLDGVHAAGFQTVLTNSAGLAGALSDETGTGVVVFNTSPTLVTPTLGAATATSINGLTIDTTTGTLDITNAKTLTVTGSATISATPYTPSGTDVAIADGGTGASTAQAAINALAGGVTANRLLRGNGTNIVLGQAVLTTDVSGILPVANGGTGSATLNNVQLTGNQTIAGVKTFSTPIAVGSGGTGVTAAANATGGVAIVGTAWTNYSSTSTVAGFSSFITKEIYYKKVGKTVFVQFMLLGASNATGVTFTLPADAAAASVPSQQGGLLYLIQDNGMNYSAVGSCTIAASGTTVTCYKDPVNATAWTATNNKAAYGSLTYEAAA